MSGSRAGGMLLSMDEDLPKTLREVDAFFMGRSSVHRTLQRLARAFQEVQVEFALAGGLAVGRGGTCGRQWMSRS